jgi:type VI secretion system protein ImpK
LALGFQGKYRLRQQEGLSAVVEGVGNYVAVAEGGGDQLAPNAERKDGGGSAVRRELPYLFIAIGFLILALIVIFILWLIIGSNADSTAEAIRKLLGGGK